MANRKNHRLLISRFREMLSRGDLTSERKQLATKKFAVLIRAVRNNDFRGAKCATEDLLALLLGL